MSQTPRTHSPLPQTASPDDEISFWEIIETLQRRWKTVAAFTLGAPLLALMVGLAWPKQYEAIALIQVARVGNLQAAISGGGALTSAVESNAAAIQRLQSDAFGSRLAKQLQVPVSIKATEPKGTGLISLAVRAPSQANAERAATLALALLAEVHSEQVKGAVASLNQSLESTTQEAARTTALFKDLFVKTNQMSRLDPAVAVMLGQMQGQLLSQQSALSERQLRLELALSPLHTSATQVIEGISTKPEPVVPNISLVVLTSLFAGGLWGVLWALATATYQLRRTEVATKSQNESHQKW